MAPLAETLSQSIWHGFGIICLGLLNVNISKWHKAFWLFFLSHWFCLIFLLQAFKLFDVDRDGLVTTTELRSLIKKVSHLTCQISGKPLILSCEVDGCGYFFRSGELCQRVRLLAWYARFLFVDNIFTQEKSLSSPLPALVDNNCSGKV